MRDDSWQLTADVDEFLARAGDFLRSRPALHTMPLTRIERFRARAADRDGALFGWLESAGEVRAFAYRLRPPSMLTLTTVSREEAGLLAARLAGLDGSPHGVHSDHDTATAFADAWCRHRGATSVLAARTHLYRLGALTSLRPLAEGRGRVAGEQDHALEGRERFAGEQDHALEGRERVAREGEHASGGGGWELPPLAHELVGQVAGEREHASEGRVGAGGERDHARVVRWCREFCADVAEDDSIIAIDAGDWAGTRFGDKHYMFWETPDGTPVSMAGWTPMVAGMVRVDPVYTPARHRGRGYAGAVTATVSRAALAGGATDVVLFADVNNSGSNRVYQRLGYVRVADFTVYRFRYAAVGER